jgi:hypothetical protein
VTNILNSFREDGPDFLAKHGKIAEVVAFLASHKASFMVGSILMADGGMSVIIQIERVHIDPFHERSPRRLKICSGLVPLPGLAGDDSLMSKRPTELTRRAVSATRGVDFARVKPLSTAYTCAKPPSTNSSVPVM